jgi:fatty-acid desaturase
MKIYNVVGYSLIAIHILIASLFAPRELGLLWGAVFGFLYLIYIWFFGGVYLSDVMHMGLAHKTLNYKDWFIKFMVVFYNVTGIYINPVTWVNRHRHHHAFSDHDGDPNKLSTDGFWRTVYLCVYPYKCRKDLATDKIFQSFSFRLVSNPYFAVVSQLTSYGLLCS